MQKDIKDLIETKIQSLFDKPAKKKFDPIFTKNQNKLRTKLFNIFFICKFYLGSCE